MNSIIAFVTVVTTVFRYNSKIKQMSAGNIFRKWFKNKLFEEFSLKTIRNQMYNWPNFVGQTFHGVTKGRYKIITVTKYSNKRRERWYNKQIIVIESLSAEKSNTYKLFIDVLELMLQDMSLFTSNMDADFKKFCIKYELLDLPSRNTVESYYVSLARHIKNTSGLQNATELNDTEQGMESYSDGTKSKKLVTRYERDPNLREEAIRIHGCICKVCQFNFEETYGDYAKGYIHIHHIVPISEMGENPDVNPEHDLVPLCANCHAVVHRRKDRTLSISELKLMIRKK